MAHRILIIEDDVDILEILKIVFEDEGYNVVASNNSEIIDHIYEVHPDLIVLDVQLVGSDKDGPTITKELKSSQATADIPVILISAHPDLYNFARLSKADDYLKKPFDLTVVLNKTKLLLK